jgi:recombination protein RecT
METTAVTKQDQTTAQVTASHGEKRITAKSLFERDEVKHKFQELLGKRSTSFITSVLQIVASNDLLVKADPNSIYHAAALAATLDLPLNNALGFAYIIPFKQNYKEGDQWKNKVVAQFQIGTKGYKQLALRSGQFKTIHATDVREGEIKKYDRLTGAIVFEWIDDEEKREAAKIVGYVSYFELLNGFSQTFYMTVEKLRAHGKKYSQTFAKDKGLWKDDFHSMALKTVTKLNLSKNAPLSVEMQKAIIVDQAVINNEDATDITYVDGTPDTVEDAALEEASEPVTIETLNALVEEKMEYLTKKEFDDCKRILNNKETESYEKLYEMLKSKVA